MLSVFQGTAKCHRAVEWPPMSNSVHPAGCGDRPDEVQSSFDLSFEAAVRKRRRAV